MSHAEASVIDAPKPSICWYVLFSSTVILITPEPLPVEKLTSFCWARCSCKLAVVSQTLTLFPTDVVADACECCSRNVKHANKAISMNTMYTFGQDASLNLRILHDK